MGDRIRGSERPGTLRRILAAGPSSPAITAVASRRAWSAGDPWFRGMFARLGVPCQNMEKTKNNTVGERNVNNSIAVGIVNSKIEGGMTAAWVRHNCHSCAAKSHNQKSYIRQKKYEQKTNMFLSGSYLQATISEKLSLSARTLCVCSCP